jgi:hypothetical protein
VVTNNVESESSESLLVTQDISRNTNILSNSWKAFLSRQELFFGLLFSCATIFASIFNQCDMLYYAF